MLSFSMCLVATVWYCGHIGGKGAESFDFRPFVT